MMPFLNLIWNVLLLFLEIASSDPAPLTLYRPHFLTQHPCIIAPCAGLCYHPNTNANKTSSYFSSQYIVSGCFAMILHILSKCLF